MLENMFSPQNVDFLTKLGVGMLCGFMIGIERKKKGKDAGISTNTLVIVGAMLFTFISTRVDPMSTSRIAAQIVSGIGFLGAGLIIREGLEVKNLTTAANIWFDGAIGMAIGFGFYMIAIFASIAGVIISRVPHVKKSKESKILKF